MATGVYAIRNKVNGKVYVGSSGRSISQRWSNHLWCLQKGRHASRHLQAAWNRYGEDSFDWLILEECPSADCVPREQHWIDQLDAANRKNGYNARLVAHSNLGVTPGPETRAKLSAALRGRKHSPERVAKVSKALKGRGYGSEVRANMSAGQMGKKHSEATKAKMSITRKGRKYSEAHCKAISEGNDRRFAQIRAERGDDSPWRKRGVPVMISCLECGALFRKIGPAVTCGEACSHARNLRLGYGCPCSKCEEAKRARETVGIECVTCGRRFIPTSPRGQSCSPECSRARRNHKQNSRRRVIL